MLDIVGALFIGAYLAALVAVLIWSSVHTLATRVAATAACLAWLLAVTALTGSGVLAPGRLGPLPPGLVPFAVLLLSLLLAWRLSDRMRGALSKVDVRALIGLHVFRLGGVFFVALGLQQRLAPAFAFTAGAGDMLVGAGALIISLRSPTDARIAARRRRVWNLLGLLDLLIAVAVAATAVPGSRIGIFAHGPGMSTMTTRPWIFVPGAIVPALFLTHLLIARANAARRSAAATSASLTTALEGGVT
jgi:hypothetical protein